MEYEAVMDNSIENKSDVLSLEEECKDLEFQRNIYRDAFFAVANSNIWKLTKPLRAVLDAAKSVKRSVAAQFNRQKEDSMPSNTDTCSSLLFSIVLCSENRTFKSIKRTIQSCIEQNYSNWELIIASNSSGENSDKLEKYISAFDDSRIMHSAVHGNNCRAGLLNYAISMSNGDYIVFADEEGTIVPCALNEIAISVSNSMAELIYTDEIEVMDNPLGIITNSAYKPDFSPDMLRSYNYIGDFFAVKKSLLIQLNFLDEKCGNDYIYDILLKATEKTDRIHHIPSALFHRPNRYPKTPYYKTEYEDSKTILENHLDRCNFSATVEKGLKPYTYHVVYSLTDTPLISIIIPNKDHKEDLKKCIESIKKSSYSNIEIIIVENNSTEKVTFDYYESLNRDNRIRVLQYIGEFNYSAINNFGVCFAKGDYILLLNNDVEIITENWLQEMLMFAQRSDVGAVGAMLYYPDDTIQHAGVIIGLGEAAGHSHKNMRRNKPGYMCRAAVVQNYSAVTAACLLTKKEVWNRVDGLDEHYKVAFNDVDYCLKVRNAGYLIVWTPYAELYHYESKSRGVDDTAAKAIRAFSEIARIQRKWKTNQDGIDPYYNRNLTLKYEDFGLKTKKERYSNT